MLNKLSIVHSVKLVYKETGVAGLILFFVILAIVVEFFAGLLTLVAYYPVDFVLSLIGKEASFYTLHLINTVLIFGHMSLRKVSEEEREDFINMDKR